MRYTEQAEKILLSAGIKARNLGHGHVGTCHILLALLEHIGPAGNVLRSSGMDPAVTTQMVTFLYGEGTSGLPLPQGFTPGAREVLRGAVAEARFQQKHTVQPEHVLLSLLRRDSVQLLFHINGISTEEIFHRLVEYTMWQNAAPQRN